MAQLLKLEFKTSSFPFLLQRHLRHSPQLFARLDPRRTQEADSTVSLQPEGTSSSSALYQTETGKADIPVALLRLPKHAQEQVHLYCHSKYI